MNSANGQEAQMITTTPKPVELQQLQAKLAAGSVTLADGTFIPAWERYGAPDYMFQLVSGHLE